MRRNIVVIGLALATFTTVHAGQLHIEHFTLLDAYDDGASVVHGTVVSFKEVAKRDPVVELKVKRVFAGKTPSAGAVAAVDSVSSFHLYPGVVWDNPRKSPIERRAFGEMRGAKPGDEVLVIVAADARMIAANADNVRAAELVFDDAARKRYSAETRARLEADIANDHIATLALAALDAKHGGPSAGAFLRMGYPLQWQRYRDMKTDARQKFLAGAADIARADATVRKALFSIALSDIDPKALPELAKVAALLDVKRKDDLDAMRTLYSSVSSLLEKGLAVDVTPLAGFIAAYYVNRPDHHREDGDLQRLLSRMTPEARTQVATTFLASVHSSSNGKDGLDGRLLEEAARLLVESPPGTARVAGVLAALANIDPSGARSTSAQSEVLDTIARIGMAIVEVSPSSQAEVTRILDAAKARVPRATLSPQSLEPPRRGPLPEESATLAPGESHTFANGSELNHLREPPVLTVGCDPSSASGESSSLSYTTPSGYREWWNCGYLMHIEDEDVAKAKKSARLKVRAVPMAVPPARMDFDDARALGERALEGRGCVSGNSTDQESDMGWMRFTSATTSGAKCTVLMGMYSRTVVRVDAPNPK